MIPSLRIKGRGYLSLLGPLVLFWCVPAALAEPSTEEVIAKAREYLGGDEALDAVQSIYYRGTFESGDGRVGEIEIIFKKPLFQRVKTVMDDLEEVTALSYYDGWRKVTQRGNDSNWTIVFLDADQIRELQANTWENLNFFKNIERRRGRIENHGLVNFEGESAVKLTFRHPGNIHFDRYFDPQSGRLLMTEASSGGQIREQGENRVDGILFPESITMSQEDDVRNRIQFEEIEVNREFDDDKFDVPSMAPDASGRLPQPAEEDLMDIPPAVPEQP